MSPVLRAFRGDLEEGMALVHSPGLPGKRRKESARPSGESPQKPQRAAVKTLQNAIRKETGPNPAENVLGPSQPSKSP